ncbi:MAG: hypothetical protein AB7S54_08055 [Bacteroidales bacterium]
MRYFFIIPVILLLFTRCSNDEKNDYPPIVLLKNSETYTVNGADIPVGGKLFFGITATTGSAPLTNLRVTRIINGQRTREVDCGFYIKAGGLDTSFYFAKSSAAEELWEFFVMNANRDSASTTRRILLGEGSAYGPINHYASLKIGMQNSSQYPNYVDLHTGALFSKTDVAGHEDQIDLVGFVYLTSGVMSPTLCCPAYTGSSSVTTHYPEILAWTVRNATSYDYYSSDYNLVHPDDFDSAQNDSLLVASYKPEKTSGLCKYCYTNRIIPFKTANGKYGLVKVIHADTVPDGYMDIEIKVQQ